MIKLHPLVLTIVGAFNLWILPAVSHEIPVTAATSTPTLAGSVSRHTIHLTLDTIKDLQVEVGSVVTAGQTIATDSSSQELEAEVVEIQAKLALNQYSPFKAQRRQLIEYIHQLKQSGGDSIQIQALADQWRRLHPAFHQYYQLRTDYEHQLQRYQQQQHRVSYLLDLPITPQTKAQAVQSLQDLYFKLKQTHTEIHWAYYQSWVTFQRQQQQGIQDQHMLLAQLDSAQQQLNRASSVESPFSGTVQRIRIGDQSSDGIPVEVIIQ